MPASDNRVMSPRPDGESRSSSKEPSSAEATARSKNDLNGNNGPLASAVDDDEDEETLALSKLRCASLQTEEVVEKTKEKAAREARRRNRCADYPGLAFGSPMFGSDTMMKFNIIKNELHNIMKSQLKRVDGEVSAFSKRIKALDDNLEKSEAYIKTATVTLAEAVQLEVESRKEEHAEEQEECAMTQFDAQLKLLEGKLFQAKMLASQVSEDFTTSATTNGNGHNDQADHE